MIGIILDRGKIKKIPNHNKETDQYVRFYTKQARRQQVDLCFYSLKKVSVADQKVSGYVYSYKDDTLVPRKMDIPKINLYKVNAYVRKEKTVKKINKLKKKGIIFFNFCTQHDRCKYKGYKYLLSFDHIRNHLPETVTLTYDNLVRMMNKFPIVFVKPKKGGQGNKITIIYKRNGGYTSTRIYKRSKTTKTIAGGQLRDFYNRTFVKPSKFIVQQGISLKTYKGKKVDFRVSPQKNKHDRWQITGIMGRVANPGWDVTNVDQGGKSMYKIKKVIAQNEIKQIKRLSLSIAHAFEKRLSYLNDLGLDFAVDKDGRIWYLEANIRPNRKKANVRRNRIPFQHVCTIYKQTAKRSTPSDPLLAFEATS